MWVTRIKCKCLRVILCIRVWIELRTAVVFHKFFQDEMLNQLHATIIITAWRTLAQHWRLTDSIWTRGHHRYIYRKFIDRALGKDFMECYLLLLSLSSAALNGAEDHPVLAEHSLSSPLWRVHYT